MQAHLLIDGYNVILGLPHLKEIFQRDKERSRDQLERVARNIHNAGHAVAIVSGRFVWHGARSFWKHSDGECLCGGRFGCLLL